MSLPQPPLRPPLRPKSPSSRGILAPTTKQNISKPSALSSAPNKRHATAAQNLTVPKRSSAQAKENQQRTGKLAALSQRNLPYSSTGADFWQKEKEDFFKKPVPLNQSKNDEKKAQRTGSTRRSRPVIPTIVVHGSRFVLIEQGAAADVASSAAEQGATTNDSVSPTPTPLDSLPETSIESPGPGRKIASGEDTPPSTVPNSDALPECPITPPHAPVPEAAISSQVTTTPPNDSIVDAPVEEAEPRKATNAVVAKPELSRTFCNGSSSRALRVTASSWDDTDLFERMPRSEVIALSRLISINGSDIEQEAVASEMILEEETQPSTADDKGSISGVHDTSQPPPPLNHEDIAPIPSVEKSMEQAPPAPFRRVVVSEWEDFALARLISISSIPTIPDLEEEKQMASKEAISSEKQLPSGKDAEPSVASIAASAVLPPLLKDEQTSSASHEDRLMMKDVQVSADENAPATTVQTPHVVSPRPSTSALSSSSPGETPPAESLSLSTSVSLFSPRTLLAPLLQSHPMPQKSPWKRFKITSLPIPIPCVTAPSSSPARVSTPEVEIWKVSFPSPAEASAALKESWGRATLDLPKGYTSTPLDVTFDEASGWSIVESTSTLPFEHYFEDAKGGIMQPKRVTFDLPPSDSSCTSSFDPYVASGFCDYVTNNESYVPLADRLWLSPQSSLSDHESYQLVDEQEAGDDDIMRDGFVIVEKPVNSVPRPDVYDLDEYFAGWRNIGDRLDGADIPRIVVIPPIEDAVLVSGMLG